MFSANTTAFLADLLAHNDRDWFAANRDRYEKHWKAAAKAFSEQLAAALARHTGGPVTAKLFRIHRDTRFSKDKTPYNPHVHMAFHSDGRRDLGWMVGLEPAQLVVGYGLFQFSKSQLEAWRAAVDGPAGADLQDRIAAARAEGARLDEPQLKRVPAPFAKDHPSGDLLRRKGIVLWSDNLKVEAAFGPGAAERVATELRRFDGLRQWMTAHIPE